jgi:ubiquinone/menaquinone biosynthesis C-methylase UbiE
MPSMSGPYDPFLYDIATPETFGGDVEWYRRKARESGGPVLELGAGTGRMTLAIASDGIEIHALDADSGMLERLRSKLRGLSPDAQQRVHIVNADMRLLRLEQTFALILVPYRAFLHNVTRDDQLACLQSIARHLAPDGRLAFNVFHPSLHYMAQNAGPLAGVWRWTNTVALADGGRVLRSEANRYDTVRQRVESQHRYGGTERTDT